MISILLARKIAELFIMMFLGFAIVKLHILKPGDSIVLSKISLYLIMPCVIISAFQIDFTPEVKMGFLLAVGVAIVIHIILMFIGYLSKKFFNANEIEQASIIYSNAGNLIIPIIISLFGSKWVIYSSAFIAVQLIFLWTHCKSLFSENKKIYLKEILLNINMLSIFMGIILLVFRIKLPTVLVETTTSVGYMIGPVGMLITGMLITGVNLRKMLKNKRIYIVTVLRMLICPLLIVLAIKGSGVGSLVPNGSKILLILFLATATPVASTVTQFAQVYKKDAEYASAINIVTTILCIITMPLFVALYNI